MNRKFLHTSQILIVLLVALLAVGQASAYSFSSCKEGSGEMETRQLSLEEFQAIDVGGAFDIDVSFGSRQSVEVTIDDNLWDLFEAEVKGKWLNFDWERNCSPSDECRIKIVVNTLEEVSVHGACNLDISDFKGHEFTYKLSGAGELKMDGKVDNLEVKISGAGEADTTDLIAKNVRVHISGAGTASVYAEDRIKGRISGVGNLTYYGDPDEKDTRVSGLGNIRKR